MIHGLDTSLLVAAEVDDHASHLAAKVTIARLLTQGDRIAIAPQVLAEFVHIVTDQRRFPGALGVNVAQELALEWWTARDTVHVFPDDRAVLRFLTWVQQFSLGRKRLLDTLLAATYESAGITSLLTLNPRDFNAFGPFQCITPDPV